MRNARSTVTLTALVLLASPLAAGATEFAVKIEPGVTIPLTAPQSDIYDTGGGQTVKALFGINSYIDIGPAATFQFLPAEAANAQSGVVQGFGASLRVKRPHDGETYYGISPWFDADAMYVRTGDLNRPGLAAAVGLAVPLGKRRQYWAGPFVRYTQVVQTPSRAGYDNRDAKLLSLGISFELGSGLKLAKAPDRMADATPAAAPVADTVSCPDRDADTIPDDIDHCPEVKGPMDSFGCPPYKKVVVKRDKLELKEKLYFKLNEATLETESFPVLDDVVVALQDNKGFRVQVEGHTDSSGNDDKNQTLSEERAGAVLDYLVSHGVSKTRLVSKGFSSSVPTDTNKTAAGRENNRRVEFVVNFILIPERAK